MFSLKAPSKRKVLSTFSLLLYFCLGGYLLVKYTPKEGLYFEFSLLSFLGLAIAGFYNSSRFAVAWVAFALPQIGAWFIDIICYSFLDHSLFGLLESKFHPGISNIDFYVYQYPLIWVPLAWSLLLTLPKPTKTPFRSTIVFSIVGLLLSRFVFRGDADVNCSTLSCLTFLQHLPAQYYPWIFMTLYMALTLILVPLITWYFRTSNEKNLSAKHPSSFLVMYLLFSLSLLLSMSRRFSNLPRFYCHSSPSAQEGVELQCKYALDLTGTHFSQYFVLKNNSKTPQQCNLYMNYNNKNEIMYGAVLIRPRRSIKLSVSVPNPIDPAGSHVYLIPECSSIF